MSTDNHWPTLFDVAEHALIQFCDDGWSLDFSSMAIDFLEEKYARIASSDSVKAVYEKRFKEGSCTEAKA